MNKLTKLQTLRENAGKAQREASASIHDIRNQREGLIDGRKEVAFRSGLKADAMSALDAGFDRYFQDARRDLSIGGLVKSRPPRFRSPRPEVMLALAIEAIRPEIRKLFEAEIDRHFASGDGISSEDRTAKLAEIDAKIEEIERVEEAMIRASEALGQPVLRRADAWPDALLMSDRALGLA